MTRMSCDLLEQLQTIPDPRRLTRNRKHLLSDVLLSGFCGVLADCNNFVAIADWARHHEDFLRTLVMVLRVATCPVSGAETIETRYFISSLRPRARRLARVIRSHWMIENGLHWVLDVVFREDARRLYDRTAAKTVGLLNRLSASLLRGDTSKGSLTVKRKRAAWNVGYLAQLLGLPIP